MLMVRCPACSSTFTRPVPLSAMGRLRARLTKKRPWACWHCGWRAWVVPADEDGGGDDEGQAGREAGAPESPARAPGSVA